MFGFPEYSMTPSAPSAGLVGEVQAEFLARLPGQRGKDVRQPVGVRVGVQPSVMRARSSR